MTNPNHTDTSRSGDLVERLRENRLFYKADCSKEAADRIEADAKRIVALERDRAALAKQLSIAERKLKSVTKLWYSLNAALGEKQ